MTYPEQGSPEPPTNQQPPYEPGSPSPQAWYPPGVAPVPSQPQAPTESDPYGYPAQPGYPPPSYPTQPGYPAQPGYQPGYPVDPSYAGAPYAPPPKSRNGLLIALVAVALVLCLTGGVLGGIFVVRALNTGTSPTAGPATAPIGDGVPTTQPQTASTRSTAPSGFNGDLNQLLIARPSGSQPWEDFAVQDGTMLTNAQMAGLFTNEAEMDSDLRSFNYRRGAVNHWSKDRVSVLILLFQFDNSVGSRAFVQSTKNEGLEGYVAKGQLGDVADSQSFVDETPDEDGQRSIIFVSLKGGLVSYVTVWYPDAIDTAGATALAQQQHDRLP